MSATVNVGMLELDRKLSKVLDCARQQPVSVSRYGSPWVWVVSHETWIGQIQLTRYVPPRHPLVALREHIDDTLRAHAALLRQASLECGLTLDAAILCRTHILQLLYPAGSKTYFHEQIAYNLLFRWFAGLSEGNGCECAPAFDDELDAVAGHADIAELLRQALDDGLLTPANWAMRKRAAQRPAGTGRRPLAPGGRAAMERRHVPVS